MTTVDISDADMQEIVAACNCAIWFLARSAGNQAAPSPRLEDAPDWAVESTYDSVRAVLSGVTMTQLWQRWTDVKHKDGWVYGEVKDPVAKTHPCLVDDYWQLPEYEIFKDHAYLGIVWLYRQRQAAREQEES